MERHHRRINSTKRRKLIAAYKLPGAPGTQPSWPLDTEDDCNAAVVNNSVMSFAEGLSGLNREYIRKSYLLASSYVSDVLKIHARYRGLVRRIYQGDDQPGLAAGAQPFRAGLTFGQGPDGAIGGAEYHRHDAGVDVGCRGHWSRRCRNWRPMRWRP